MMVSSSKRIKQLEAAFAEQRREIEQLRATVAQHAGPDAAPGFGVATVAPARSAETGLVQSDDLTARRSTRRALVTGGAVAAGAALAGSMVAPHTAAAADGGNMVIGGDNTSAAGDTNLAVGAGALLTNTNAFTVSSGLTSSSFPAAIGGAANGGRVTNGVYGYTDHRGTDSNTGHAVIARRETSARSNILMPPVGQSPTLETTVNHTAGSLRVDSSRNLWFCVTSGTPGTWRRISGPASSGALHLVAPARVYDSRLDAAGVLPTGASRIVSVADGRDVLTYAINAPNLVPAGAVAVLFNVTITGTVGAGVLAVAPGNQTVITASTINWSTIGQTVANASSSTLDTNRQLNVLSGGAGLTHFIIDITGYTL